MLLQAFCQPSPGSGHRSAPFSTDLQPMSRDVLYVPNRLCALLQVPLPVTSPDNILRVICGNAGPQPVRLQGICTAMATPTSEVYARHTRCCFCGTEATCLEEHPVACCLSRRAAPKSFDEELSCRQYMQACDATLSHLPFRLYAPS